VIVDWTLTTSRLGIAAAAAVLAMAREARIPVNFILMMKRVRN
jgi:hypothetical protein